MSPAVAGRRVTVGALVVAASFACFLGDRAAAEPQSPNQALVVEVFTDRGDSYIRAGSLHGLKVGGVVSILGPTVAETRERRTIGSATVLEVWEMLSRVSLDRSASSYSGAKLARLALLPPAVAAPAAEPKAGASAAQPAPTVTQPAPPPPPPTTVATTVQGELPAPAAPAPPGGALVGHAERSRRRMTLYNDSAIRWTNCELRLPTNRRYRMERLEATDHDGIADFRFEQDGPEVDLPENSVAVKCDQGQAKFSF